MALLIASATLVTSRLSAARRSSMFSLALLNLVDRGPDTLFSFIIICLLNYCNVFVFE